MIQPLKLSPSVSFRGDAQADMPAPLKNAMQATATPVAENTEKKDPFLYRLKKKTTGIIKSFNNISMTTKGAVKGVLAGGIATGIFGIAGKNIRNADGNIWGSLKGILGDSLKVAKKAVCFVPSAITKSPIENVKNLLNTPLKFYGSYLKGNKAVAAIATAAGLATTAFFTVRGKMLANLKNADVDHATNLGHNK